MSTVSIGEAYAVTTGTFAGEFYICVETNRRYVKFLTLPNMNTVQLPLTEVTSGISTGILELQENLPSHVIDVCMKQHTKNENEKSIHRR
jgi:hypothetical protein